MIQSFNFFLIDHIQYTDIDHFCIIYVMGCAEVLTTLKTDGTGESKEVEMELVSLK